MESPGVFCWPFDKKNKHFACVDLRTTIKKDFTEGKKKEKPRV